MMVLLTPERRGRGIGSTMAETHDERAARMYQQMARFQLDSTSQWNGMAWDE